MSRADISRPRTKLRPTGHFRVKRVEDGNIVGRLAGKDPLFRRNIIGVACVPIEMVRRTTGHYGYLRHFRGRREVPELEAADLQHYPIVAADLRQSLQQSCRRDCRPRNVCGRSSCLVPSPFGRGLG